MTKKELFKNAHKMAKKIKTEYPDTNYQANLSIALKMLYKDARQKNKLYKDIELCNNYNDIVAANINTIINIDDFIAIKNRYKGLFYHILTSNELLVKNGKVSKDQEIEHNTTTSTYKINYNEIEDIEQFAIEKMLNAFKKYNEIKLYNLTKIWQYSCLNAVKFYSKQLKKFAVNKNINLNTDMVYNSIYNSNDLSIETKDAISKLDPTDQKIVDLLFQGYQKIEIASMIGKSRQTVYNHVAAIQKAIKIELACN